MPSLEIGRLATKAHGHFLRDINAILTGLGLNVLSFEGVYSDSKERADRASISLSVRP